MTFEFIDTTKNDTLMIICTEPTQPAPSLNTRIQPWLKLVIGAVCLSQGLRLLAAGDAIATLMGLGLLICLPSCCYFGLKDYQGLQQARAGRSARRSRQLHQMVS
jgi:hypothetical protein